jgi:hypothetical protein
MKSVCDFSCHICQSTTFEGEEFHYVTTMSGTYKLCILCSMAAERLGWSLE